MKPKLKAPGTKRLKLKYDNLFSRVAFKINLRRYTAADHRGRVVQVDPIKPTLKSPGNKRLKLK